MNAKKRKILTAVPILAVIIICITALVLYRIPYRFEDTIQIYCPQTGDFRSVQLKINRTYRLIAPNSYYVCLQDDQGFYTYQHEDQDNLFLRMKDKFTTRRYAHTLLGKTVNEAGQIESTMSDYTVWYEGHHVQVGIKKDTPDDSLEFDYYYGPASTKQEALDIKSAMEKKGNLNTWNQ